jgi:hypothetical protein
VVHPARRALLLASLLLVLVACGGPAAVSLEELALDPDAHEGAEVITIGTVLEFDESDGALERHIIVEDLDQNRVRLVPIEAAEPFIGADVEVSGRFFFEPERGRTIEVDEIREARGGG